MIEKIRKYKFKKGLQLEFEILDFDQLFTQSSKEISKPHRTEFYQILWFQEGSPTHLLDFKQIRIKPNSLLFVNKNSVQIFDSKTKFRGKMILFTDSFFCKTIAASKFLRNSILFNDLFFISQIDISKSISDFKAIFQQLEKEISNLSDDFQSDIIRICLQNIMLHSSRKVLDKDLGIRNDANLDYVLKLKDLIEDNFLEHKKVSFYSKKMFITSKRLNQATTKTFGKTPKEIINDRVLLESKRVLAHTSGTVKEIAFTLGFERPTNFIKYFKKHTGKTPIEFRAKFI